MTETTNRKVNLPKLVDPRFLSVVSLPANRSGFKIIRSREDAEHEVPAPKRGEKSVLKRSGQEALLSIILPEGIDETVAIEIMRQFALTDEYRLTEAGGRFVLLRNGIEDDQFAETHESVVPIMLEGGLQANIASSVFRQDKRNSGVKLVRLTFDRSKFTGVDAVKEWLDKNEIDFIEGGVEVDDEIFNVIRHANTSEKGAVQIEEGVIGIVARGNVQDVPLSIERQVVRDAFGQFGFGHLVFSDYLIDAEFSETSRNALFVLGDVLDNILFWSDQPIKERLDLIDNAVTQFAAFMRGLVESIPSSIMGVINQSTVENSDRRNEMTTKRRVLKKTEVKEPKAKTEVDEEEVQRTDGVTEETETETTAEVTEDTTEREDETESTEGKEHEFVTRSELVDAVTEAVTAAFAAHLERSESEETEGQTEETGETEETAERADGDTEESGEKDVMADMVKTMSKMTDAISAVGDKVGGFEKRLKTVEGTAVTRGDEGTEYTDSDNGEEPSVFKGIFGGRSVG